MQRLVLEESEGRTGSRLWKEQEMNQRQRAVWEKSAPSQCTAPQSVHPRLFQATRPLRARELIATQKNVNMPLSARDDGRVHREHLQHLV